MWAALLLKLPLPRVSWQHTHQKWSQAPMDEMAETEPRASSALMSRYFLSQWRKSNTETGTKECGHFHDYPWPCGSKAYGKCMDVEIAWERLDIWSRKSLEGWRRAHWASPAMTQVRQQLLRGPRQKSLPDGQEFGVCSPARLTSGTSADPAHSCCGRELISSTLRH